MDDLFSLKSVQNEIGNFFGTMNGWASEVDGRLAFVAGAVSWFMIEQSIKWMQDNVLKFIMFSALTAAGIGLVTIVTSEDEPGQSPPPPAASTSQLNHAPANATGSSSRG